jgi:hypothetical protein
MKNSPDLANITPNKLVQDDALQPGKRFQQASKYVPAE